MNEEEQQEEHSCDDNAIYYEFTEDGHRYHGYECGICGKLLQTGQENSMSDDDVKEQALKQAQEAYGLFIWFVKWFSYVMIFMITLMFLNNWFDDGTGSMFMPDEIYEDQYDPKGLNKKKGIQLCGE